jgi:hypothetical protein
VIAWLATSWSRPPPPPGTPVPLGGEPAAAAAALAAEPAGALAPGPSGTVLRWPAADAPVALKDGAGAVVYEGLGARPAAEVIHKRVWWNRLLGNPAGYLPDGAALDEIHLGVPEREVLPFGPAGRAATSSPTSPP